MRRGSPWTCSFTTHSPQAFHHSTSCIHQCKDFSRDPTWHCPPPYTPMGLPIHHPDCMQLRGTAPSPPHPAISDWTPEVLGLKDYTPQRPWEQLQAL